MAALALALAPPAAAQQPVAPTPASPEVARGAAAWARGDYKAAVEQWRGPAAAGDAEAQFRLGQAYRFGRGVSVDPVQAENWFRKAALQDHVPASANYALMLFQANRKAEAVPWLEKAAARDEPRAQLVLGTMLFNADSVARDYPRAYSLVTRAARAGLKPATETLAQMDRYVAAEDRQKGLALAGSAPAGTAVASAAPVRPAPASAPASSPPRPAPRPAPAVAAAPTPRPISAAVGRYRVQLGAFRDAGNARALWSRIGARMGGEPAYVEGGGVTRLQAGPFATRAAAESACTRADGPCTVLGS